MVKRFGISMRGSHWEWGWVVVQDLFTRTYIVTSSLKFVTFVGIASWKYTLLASTYQPGGGRGGEVGGLLIRYLCF